MTKDDLQKVRDAFTLLIPKIIPTGTPIPKAIAILDAALAAPEQEPTDCTRIMREQGKPYPRTCPRCKLGPCSYLPTIAIAAPVPAPQREWQGLTDEEISRIHRVYCASWDAQYFAHVTHAIEAALRAKNEEKNHG